MKNKIEQARKELGWFDSDLIHLEGEPKSVTITLGIKDIYKTKSFDDKVIEEMEKGLSFEKAVIKVHEDEMKEILNSITDNTDTK